MNVHESIRKLRESKDLTQEQFGKIAGVSPMAVSQWECGRAVPRMGAIQRLADFFNVPKSQIMGDEQLVEYAVVSLDGLSGDEKELIDLFRKMDKSDRAVLLSTARRFAAFAGEGEKRSGQLVETALREEVD